MDFRIIDQNTRLCRARYGGKALRLSHLPRMGIATPLTAAVSIPSVQSINRGEPFGVQDLLRQFPPNTIFALRPSPELGEWTGFKTLINVGTTEKIFQALVQRIGADFAGEIYLRSILDYSLKVFKLDSEIFEECLVTNRKLKEKINICRNIFYQETHEPYPQDSAVQLLNSIRYMARAWESSSAQMLRQAQGYPQESGVGILVQQMVYSPNKCLHKVGKSRNMQKSSGLSCHQIKYHDPRKEEGKEFKASGDGLEEAFMTDLVTYHNALRHELQDEFDITFVTSETTPVVIDYRPTPRSVEAEIHLAVELVNEGIIDKPQALQRIDPESLSRAIHTRLAEFDRSRILSRGVAASPGAASGVIVFSSKAAEEQGAMGHSCILVRLETGPEDIRGMHTAKGVLTGRGGLTSHAAVIARSLGVPCVSAVAELEFDAREKCLKTTSGKRLEEGDIITIDGSAGIVVEGHVAKVRPSLDASFDTFLSWADELRDIGVRANADTIEEVNVAKSFQTEGIGLCRTEHMFFDKSRLTTMREMIFTDSPEERKLVLRQLLPMQKADFYALFKTMSCQPVCIRLLDPPLHEFLPRDREEMQELAYALDLPVSQVMSRCEELREFNPMLGLRGVRLGIIVPEIYEMQARAIFEAVAELKEGDMDSFPEIMIPLVSTNREVEIITDLVQSVATEVQASKGFTIKYKIGVMVETPRAAMRAGDIAEQSDFLSFGTNDLTQLTYGISRDDAAKIIDEYLKKEVISSDPFASIDREGVGELLQMAIERGREQKPDLAVSICGEHSADVDTIRFCREAGFSYLSCTPYRVPIARLAAAQCAIKWPQHSSGSGH